MINKAWNVFIFHLKQAWATPRIPLLFLVIGIFIFSTVQPVSNFSADVGIAASPWAFPHITNDYICQLVIMATVILLFCDAPFQNGSHLYILPRAGNAAWNVGICLYIVTLSFLYIMSILLASTLALVPHIGLYSGWGKIWGTLSRTTASLQYGLTFSVNDYIIGAYTPFGATITAFLLSWACCVWLGLVIFFLNGISNTMIGCLAAAAFVFLDITIWNEWSYSLYRISPVTMTQLSAISRQESLYGLSKTYAVCFFAISIVVLQGLCILTPSIRGRTTRYKKGESISMINALSVQEVSKVYGTQKVLNNISFDCTPGKIYGLIGRNGSGKTVLLKCICGLVKPTNGAIYVWGKQVGRDIEFPEKIGFIIEHPGFLLHESGLENLKHLASIRKRIDVEQIQACMKLVGLDPNLKKPVSKYSLGMRQRLGIAQAIMENPNFLILDEPMNGLDNQGVKHIRSVLKELSSNGTTILLASHSMEDIDFLCDEVYQMDAGILRKRIH